jgi:hypothetical protein
LVEATGLEPKSNLKNCFIFKAFSVYSPIVRQIFPLSKIIIFTANASSTSMKRRGGFEALPPSTALYFKGIHDCAPTMPQAHFSSNLYIFSVLLVLKIFNSPHAVLKAV